MQKNAFLTLDGTSAIISGLLRETQGLPCNTPVFVSDSKGRICYSRGIGAKDKRLVNVPLLISKNELDFYFSKRHTCDCMTLEMQDDEKSFLVLSKTEQGFSEGVICSCSEKGCTRMGEYVEKLASFKDFLDTFSDIHFSGLGVVAHYKALEMRINGAFRILRLSGKDMYENCNRFAIPLYMLTEKTSRFVSSCEDGVKISLECKDGGESTAVLVPITFAELLVSAVGVVLRLSKNSSLHVCVSRVSDKQSVVQIQTLYKKAHDDTGIFERSVIAALEAMGAEVSAFVQNGKYTLSITLENAAARDITVAETDELSEQISVLLSDVLLRELLFAVSK